MPSAPLFYQPLVRAAIAMTPIGGGKETLYDAQQRQLDFSVSTTPDGQLSADPQTEAAKAFDKSPSAPALGAMFHSIRALQKQLPGSTPITHFQIALDDAGWIANRVETALRNHPDLLDTVSPDKAPDIAMALMKSAADELAKQPGMVMSGETLEIAPSATATVGKIVEGTTPVTVQEATAFAATLNRELQRGVTPMPPDSTSPAQWLEDASGDVLALWPGAVSATTKALGVQVDLAKVEEAATAMRGSLGTTGEHAESVRSLTALLGAAGIDGSPAAAPAAFSVLQSTPLEGVPAGIAQAIVGHAKLPDDMSSIVAQRIVETRGTEGNVHGLLAQIDAEIAKQKPPPVPGPAPAPEPNPAPGPKPDPDERPAPGPTPTPTPTPTPAPEPTPAPPTAPAPAQDAPVP